MHRILLLFFSCVLAAVAAESEPNIILILADDLGYGEIGCFGSKLIQTPNLDRMAKEGMKLTNFYAGSPVCAPSRSVLMTGLHTGHTRVRGNAGKVNRDPQNLRAEDVTVAELLKKAGYSTALFGKWGIGHEGSQGIPTKKGFDYFYGYLDQFHAHNPYSNFVMRNTEVVKLRNKLARGATTRKGDEELDENSGAGIAETPLEFIPDLMADETLKWVEENKARPFFLFWSLITPHANNEGTKFGRGQEVPDLGPYADKDWPQPDKAHAAAITRADADIGRLLELLKKLGLDERTLVIFTSDNGHHKEGGNDPELFDANGPLRGLKREMYEGGIRVPTVARWPGTISPGVESRQVGWFADFLPTACSLAGMNAPDGVDGISLVRTIQRNELIDRPHLYWEFHEGGFSQAVLMDGRWKAIRNKRPAAPIELYDLSGDLAETKDIASENPALVERARKLLNSEHTDSPDWPIKEPPLKKAGGR
jgi:arylsulfatase A-like enzyme